MASRTKAPPALFDLGRSLPEGFLYRPEFISPAEERDLISSIEELPFSDVRMHGVVARRRVVQFGWRYSFDGLSIAPGASLPDFLEPVRTRSAALAGLDPAEVTEALVTEYSPGAAIGWHRDAPPFGVVVGISLLAPCRFRLRRGEGRSAERLSIDLEPRSAYVLAGEARSAWQHSIPAVPARRYSITFRTVRRARVRQERRQSAE